LNSILLFTTSIGDYDTEIPTSFAGGINFTFASPKGSFRQTALLFFSTSVIDLIGQVL